MNPLLSGARWRKSVRSAANEACVEVANLDEAVGVRDSKNLAGTPLLVSRRAACGLIGAVKRGRYDLA